MKTGRPKLAIKERKTSIVGVRLKSTERRLIERAAKKDGRKLSDWMRLTALARAN